jgi:multidrug efflux system outer membrane protein
MRPVVRDFRNRLSERAARPPAEPGAGKSIVRASIAVLALTSLTACTVGPNYVAPKIEVRSNYAELGQTAPSDPATQPNRPSDTAPPPTRWWTTFHDPELDKLIDAAMANNFTLQRAVSALRQARAQRGVVAADLFPEVAADGGYSRFRGSKNVTFPSSLFGGGSGSSGGASGGAGASASGSSASSSGSRNQIVQSGSNALRPNQATSSSTNNGLPPGGPQSPLGNGGFPGVETSLYQIGVDASWEIDVFGGTRRNIEAATADIFANLEDVHDIRISLIAEVARDYLELRAYQQRAIIAQKNIETQKDTLNLTQERAKVGFATDLDVQRAKAQVASSQALVPPLDTQVRAMIHALSILEAKDPDALSAELTAAGPLPPLPTDVTIGIPSELLRRRPDIRRAEKQIAAANARIGAAIADYFPKFTITGETGLDSTSAKHLLDWSSRYFLLSPGVTWELFDAGRISSNVTVQKELREQATLNYRQTVLTALRDVEDSLVSFTSEQGRRKSLAESVAASALAVELAKDQYRQGLVDFLVVEDAQRELLNAQDQLVQSEALIATSIVSLYKATGGGWEAFPDRLASR